MGFLFYFSRSTLNASNIAIRYTIAKHASMALLGDALVLVAEDVNSEARERATLLLFI